MPHTYKVDINGELLKVSKPQLDQLRALDVPAELRPRISELLILDLFVYSRKFGVAAPEIMREIKALEAGEAQSFTKAAAPFERLPLHGLWHKHFFSAHFLAHNRLPGASTQHINSDLMARLERLQNGNLSDDDLQDLASGMVQEPFEDRAGQKRVTGEWIIFIPHAGLNYYLCLATHTMGDQAILDRIMAHCIRDFADLPEWLLEARSIPKSR